MFEIDKLVPPDLFAELLARDQLARQRCQHGQHLNGLRTQPNQTSGLAQFPGMDFKLEDTESKKLVIGRRVGHEIPKPQGIILWNLARTKAVK